MARGLLVAVVEVVMNPAAASRRSEPSMPVVEKPSVRRGWVGVAGVDAGPLRIVLAEDDRAMRWMLSDAGVRTPVSLMTAFPDRHVCAEAMRNGAAGVLDQALRHRRLPHARARRRAPQEATLEAAGARSARTLVFAASGTPSDVVVRAAKSLDASIRVLARSGYAREATAARAAGADVVVAAEAEVALAMTEHILTELGATGEQLDRARDRVRAELVPTTERQA